MTTRVRAIIITSFTSALVFLSLAGVNIFSYKDLLSKLAINTTVEVEFISSIIISVILGIGVLWVLFFKHKGNSFFAIGLFPAIALFPYILLADTIIKSIFTGLGQISVALIASIIYWVVCYFLILTANVLNGAVLFNIPLGQAGKAAQFIFALISSYFLIAYLFGSDFPLFMRVVLVSSFIFYFAYSTIWALQIPGKQVVFSALAITIVMLIIILLLSVWPVSSVYATLSAVVILYILLNVALERRELTGKMVWIEYVLLLLLIIIILFANSNWGINGNLL